MAASRHAGAVFRHVPIILVEGSQTAALHQAPETRRDQLFLSAPQVEPEGSLGQLADSLKFLGPQGRHPDSALSTH